MGEDATAEPRRRSGQPPFREGRQSGEFIVLERGVPPWEPRSRFLYRPSAETRPVGLENWSNCCYCNCVLQVLYALPQFREAVLDEAAATSQGPKRSLLTALGRIFVQLDAARCSRPPFLRKWFYKLQLGLMSPVNSATVNPDNFLAVVRKNNVQFRDICHHDAHEFYSYLINALADELRQPPPSPAVVAVRSRRLVQPPRFVTPHSTGRMEYFDLPAPASTVERPLSRPQSTVVLSPSAAPRVATEKRGTNNLGTPRHQGDFSSWVTELFRGHFVYETRCLCCENITRRKEPFMDVPVDVGSGCTSLTDAFDRLTRSEPLRGENRYHCDICGCAQDAERRLAFEHLPRILVVHLKRFRYYPELGMYRKVQDGMTFPLTFDFRRQWFARGKNSARAELISAQFELSGVVVHVGTSLSHGHYFSAVRTKFRGDGWALHDDTKVRGIPTDYLKNFYGQGIESGYMLFYNATNPFLP